MCGGSELQFIGPPMLLTKKQLSPKTHLAWEDALWLGWKALLFPLRWVPEKERVSRSFLMRGMWQFRWKEGSLRLAFPCGG